VASVEIYPAGELEFANVSLEGGRISGEPVFYNSGRELVPVAMILVKSKDGVVHRYVLRINGSELKLSLQERSNPVRSAYETPAEELKSQPKSAAVADKKG